MKITVTVQAEPDDHIGLKHFDVMRSLLTCMYPNGFGNSESSISTDTGVYGTTSSRIIAEILVPELDRSPDAGPDAERVTRLTFVGEPF